MAGPPRLIYVDDTSSLISYQGQWDGGDTNSVNTQWGPPFQNTLHALSGSGSFTFNFTGPSVSVMGSFLASTLPSVTCYLDGNVFPLNNISLLHLNSVPFCSLEGIVPKATPSNLTVVASGTTDNPFLFDRIQYEPDASVILDNATVVVDAFDNQIQYGSGWNKLGIIGMETSVQGASITFDFIGTQIAWMTTFDMGANATVTASAKYRIDNGTPFPFTVAAQLTTVQQYNLVSFQTGVLSPGSHRLLVEYGVDNFVNGSAPLVLDYFVIQNLTIPSPTPSPPNTTNTQSPIVIQTITPIVYRAGLSQGAIAGVIIGSLVGLAFIIFGLIRFIKGKKAAASLRQEYKPYAAYGDGIKDERMSMATL